MGNIQKHIWYFTILILYVLFHFTDFEVFKALGHVMLSINFGLLFVAFGVILFMSSINSDKYKRQVEKFYIKLAEEFSIFNALMSIVIMALLIYFGNLILAGVLFILMVMTTTFYNRGIDLIQNETTE